MNYIAVIMGLTFREAWRRKVVLLAVCMSAVFMLLYGMGFSFILKHSKLHGAMLEGSYNFLLLAGLYVVHFLTIVLSIFVSVDAVSGEISSHTVQALVTKPMRRWQYMLGKWLGYAGMICLFILLLSGCILGITYALTHYWPPHPYTAVPLLLLEALVLISLSMLGGTRLSTMANGVLLFMLYGLAFIGTWVEQIGKTLESTGAVRVGIITSLMMPVEALWRRIAYLIQPPFVSSMSLSPFGAFSIPSDAMVIYAIFYTLAALALAVYSFSRRDL